MTSVSLGMPYKSGPEPAAVPLTKDGPAVRLLPDHGANAREEGCVTLGRTEFQQPRAVRRKMALFKRCFAGWIGAKEMPVLIHQQGGGGLTGEPPATSPEPPCRDGARMVS